MELLDNLSYSTLTSVANDLIYKAEKGADINSIIRQITPVVKAIKNKVPNAHNVDIDEFVIEHNIDINAPDETFREVFDRWNSESDNSFLEEGEIELAQDFCSFLDLSSDKEMLSVMALFGDDTECFPKGKVENMASCMLSILDSLKLYDNDSLELGDETLSEVMFRKMKGHNIDLNKELGFSHLEPVSKVKK